MLVGYVALGNHFSSTSTTLRDVECQHVPSRPLIELQLDDWSGISLINVC